MKSADLGAPPHLRARVCVILNQAAFPGLGSLLMGRRAGWAQAALMVTGFVLSMGFGLWYLWGLARSLRDPQWSEAAWNARCRAALWALWWGLGLCGAAWLWALASSVDIWRREGRGPG